MKPAHLAALAEKLRLSGVPTHFDETKSRLLIEVWRAVLAGRPVSPSQIETFARRLSLNTQDALSFIFRVSERNEGGEIIGIFGLSQRKHPHKFFIDGRTFYAWCAWDALFLPPMLRQAARVESTCLQTGLTTTAEVTPEGVASCLPANAVLSILVPESNNLELNSFEAVRSSFCCNVHFFHSASAAQAWLSAKKQAFEVLSVEEGFQLGLFAFREMLEYV